MPFRKILVAYDFSEPAGRAFEYGAELATKLGAELHLVHVHQSYELKGTVRTGVPWPTTEQTERYLRFLGEELRSIARRAAPQAADKIVYHLVCGDALPTLQKLAQEVSADLICIGSTGKGAIARMLLGSVTQSMLRNSEVPVLSVH